MCWQVSISVNGAVGGVSKVFACLLGSFGTELLIAALIVHVFLQYSEEFCTVKAFLTFSLGVSSRNTELYYTGVFIDPSHDHIG